MAGVEYVLMLMVMVRCDCDDGVDEMNDRCMYVLAIEYGAFGRIKWGYQRLSLMSGIEGYLCQWVSHTAVFFG